MHAVNHVHWGMTVLKRTLQVFVLWPSIAVGSVLFGICLTGGSPLHEMVSTAFQWGNETFRSAPAGTVLVREVADEATGDSQDLPQHSAQPWRAKVSKFRAVATQQALDHAAAQLMNTYWLCVVFCAAFQLVILGPRRFIGLPGLAGP